MLEYRPDRVSPRLVFLCRERRGTSIIIITLIISIIIVAGQSIVFVAKQKQQQGVVVVVLGLSFCRGFVKKTWACNMTECFYIMYLCLDPGLKGKVLVFLDLKHDLSVDPTVFVRYRSRAHLFICPTAPHRSRQTAFDVVVAVLQSQHCKFL
jgi:hypothetical protein